MRRTFARNARSRCSNCLKPSLRVTLLFAVWVAGCNNTCFIVTSNPPTGTIGIKAGDPQPACSLTKATGAVRLVVQTLPVCRSCPESRGIQHLFVTIGGIDVHASSTADDDSPDWQKLAPQLAKQPFQVDLMRSVADQGTREPLREIVAIPAGIYRQVRVSLVGELPATDELAGKIACGGAGFNCAVMADGTVRPLLFDTGSPELRVTSERMAGRFLLIFPDIGSDLVIEIKPAWSAFVSINGGLRLLPMLTADAWVERVGYEEVSTENKREPRGG